MIRVVPVKAQNIFSCVLCDSTPRYVGPLVGWLVGQLVGRSPFYFFGVFELLGRCWGELVGDWPAVEPNPHSEAESDCHLEGLWGVQHHC